MEARNNGVSDPKERILCSRLGYLDFALSAPALFRLMFASERDAMSPELIDTANASFQHLVDNVSHYRGIDPTQDEKVMTEVIAIWSLTHGFAELTLANRIHALANASRSAIDAQFRQTLLPLIR